jgi:hypothetical protein
LRYPRTGHSRTGMTLLQNNSASAISIQSTGSINYARALSDASIYRHCFVAIGVCICLPEYLTKQSTAHNPSFEWLPTTAPIITTHARSPASLGLRRAPHSISPPSTNAQSLRRARFEGASPGAIGRPIDRQGRNDQKSPFSDICVWRGRRRVGRQCLIPATQAW